jgi:hypothetical protein
LRPYVTGDDITSSSLTRTERWALDIADMPLEAIAKKWPIAHRFLVEVVKPTRTPEALKSYKGLIDRWWQFWNHRADQMRRLRRQKRCVAFAKAAKYAVCVVAPTDWIYTNKVALVEATREDAHAICLSSMLQAWLRNYSIRSLGRDNKTMTLSISEALATFPLPGQPVATEAVDAAEEFQTTLVAWSKRNAAGMTDAMNAVHSPSTTDSEIIRLRELVERVDAGVASAYGWSGLDLSYDFREKMGPEGAIVVRHGLARATRDLVLANLIALNRSRYQAGGPSGTDTHGRTAKRAQNRRRAPIRAGLLFEESNTDESRAAAAHAKKIPSRRSKR